MEKNLSFKSSKHDRKQQILNNVHHSSRELNYSSYHDSINKACQSRLNNLEKGNIFSNYQTKYPTFLPDDFTVDETDSLAKLPTGMLTNEALKHLQTMANKLDDNPTYSMIKLTENEVAFIR